MSGRMMAWSPRWILVLLLAVFATAGFGVGAVRASNMSVAMAMMSDQSTAVSSDSDMAMQSKTGANTGNDCQDCLGGTGNHGKPMDCSPVCVAPALAVPPAELAVVLDVRNSRPVLPPSALLRGRRIGPDPSPPRSIDIV
jgi:hypothetical protein